MSLKKLIISIIAVLLLVAAGTAFAFRGVIRNVVAARFKPPLPAAQPYVPPPAQAATGTPATAQLPTHPNPVTPSKTETKPIAKEANLAVPFFSQAPHGNWAMPYQEACEEASLMMVNAYLTGAGKLTLNAIDAQILKAVDWEKERFGYYESTSAEEVAAMAREYFDFSKSRVVKVASMKDIKAQIDRGLPVVVPVAGRKLFNPYFTGAGPEYHMLVVKGYTKDGKIITNDPGLVHLGADYLYTEEVLWNAVHDWNGGDVDKGAKVIVVVEK